MTNISDWKIIYESGPGPWGFGFRQICRDMQKIGKKLYERGLMPEVKNKPQSTHGNMASVINHLTREFIVTATGSHKGRLRSDDFVWVREVNWDEGSILIRTDSPDKKPSSDVWLVDAIFKKFPTFYSISDYKTNGALKVESEKAPKIGAIIHTHHFPDFQVSVKVSHPPLNPEEYSSLFDWIIRGKKVIILKNHGSLAVERTLWKTFNLIFPEPEAATPKKGA